MPFDCGRLPRVACTALIFASACVPASVPTGPGEDPSTTTGAVVHHLNPRRVSGAASDRQVVVGEMCPQGAAGRPGIAPLTLRSVQWTDAAGDMDSVIDRGAVPQFAVYGVDGKVAGSFQTLGLADVGQGQSIVSGSYVGAPPCSYGIDVAAAATGPASTPAGSAQSKSDSRPLATRADDAQCATATAGCGLALGDVVRPDEAPEAPVAFATGGACVSQDTLTVDLDGDGVPEAFALSGVLDGIRGPAQEWTASPTPVPRCAPHFQQFNIALEQESIDGKPSDPKATVMMDVLGVVDIDGDGRRELVLALRFATVRSIVIYSPVASPQRLSLVGESTSFPR